MKAPSDFRGFSRIFTDFTDFADFLCLCNCAVAIYTDFYKAKGLIYPWKLKSYA